MIPIIKNIKKAILQAENPIGHIRFETTNINPSTYLGFGTWKLWGAGRVPVGVDESDTDFSEVEKTGGEKTHTLIESELPNLKGFLDVGYGKNIFENPYGIIKQSGTTGRVENVTTTDTWESTTASKSININFGGDQSHNNVQPYVTCYMWKRTA